MKRFQYNSCYCSILASCVDAPAIVMFQYNSCYCSIWTFLSSVLSIAMFQYNSCYCSILFLLFKSIGNCRFNTTLVTVLFDFTVTVNSDTPTIPGFFPLYYTKTLGGSINGQKKIHNETGAGTTYSKLSGKWKISALMVQRKQHKTLNP